MRSVAPDESDRFGFDENRNYITEFVAKFVPKRTAKRAVDVSIETDRAVYDLGDPVSVTVSFRNRFPVPISVPTPKQRLWGWRVDGELEASDRRPYTRPSPRTFEFRPRETKRTTFTWNGRFERTTDGHEWVLPEPGKHEISAFLAIEDTRPRNQDSTTVTLR